MGCGSGLLGNAMTKLHPPMANFTAYSVIHAKVRSKLLCSAGVTVIV